MKRRKNDMCCESGCKKKAKGYASGGQYIRYRRYYCKKHLRAHLAQKKLVRF